jgi:site-specific DNA-methyltransferase (adenine-specific)
MTQAPFALAGHNPDVLTCIANLSNDEVFTPPELANQMLDTLEQSWSSSNNGENIWKNKEVRFLDPCTKSGVFLREIVKRLNTGLTIEIPDLTERVNHILTKQVFGIGITQLTSLLARRSLYCSKNAKGKYSIAREFETNEGNIWFERTEHTWVNGKCKFCGASKSEYARSQELETHAYAFIHTNNLKAHMSELFGENMQFDVIIGNPPYQLSDGGFGISALPMYHKFVEQAKKLEPRFLTMVIPARWFTGGKGLDSFRVAMLSDNRLRKFFDFPDSNDVFPGTQIKGGVCYFLWDRDNNGEVEVTTHDRGQIVSRTSRALLETGAEVFIRYNDGVQVLKKIMRIENANSTPKYSFDLPEDKSFQRFVSARKPFGLPTTFRGKTKEVKNDLTVYQNGGIGYIARSKVTSGKQMIDNWKVFIPRAGSGSDSFPHPILGKPFIGKPGTICSETYVSIGPYNSMKEAKNVCSYLRCRLVRFIILLHKTSQSTTRSVYKFVPMQNFSEMWTDEKLYKKYGITMDEISFIESMIRPMDLDGD